MNVEHIISIEYSIFSTNIYNIQLGKLILPSIVEYIQNKDHNIHKSKDQIIRGRSLNHSAATAIFEPI